jgi:hypothetical protein
MPDDSQQTRIMSHDETRINTIAPGAVLRGRYRLDSEIGRGGMGIVYSATDLELMRKVAVKVVSGESTSTDARQRLIREARAAAALNHPHIVSVHDVGEENGIPFFVMELANGPSLSKARPVELARIVDITCRAPLGAGAEGRFRIARRAGRGSDSDRQADSRDRNSSGSVPRPHPSFPRMKNVCFSLTRSRKSLPTSPVRRACVFMRTICTGPTVALSGC